MSKEQKVAKELLRFVWESPSVYHVVDNIRRKLNGLGFQELKEEEIWKTEAQKGYYVVRNDSSIIAFYMPANEIKGFRIVATHGDSPAFKLKEQPELVIEDRYIKLNTEKYGGMIHSSWLDRPLSVAGRIVIRTKDGKTEVKLVNVDKDLLVIPNLAIHMNRDVNKGYEYNPQVDLLPLLGLGKKKEAKDMLLKEVAMAAGVSKEDILGQDLYLYVREKGRLVGIKQELIIGPKLDDLQCVHAALEAFGEKNPKEYVNVLAVFDNEEVGSTTAQGADSSFLRDTLTRVGEVQGWTNEERCRMMAGSFLISADNAHAVHPNHPEKSDPGNRPYLGGGIVIKHHGGQKYTTDGLSAATMRLWCEKAKVPYQNFYNRSDMVGGSTLGNISNSQLTLTSVDIGLPQLAMHSAIETAAGSDSAAAIKLFKVFWTE